jgi:hypothetical protein
MLSGDVSSTTPFFISCIGGDELSKFKKADDLITNVT